MNKPLLVLLAASVLANGFLLTRTLRPPTPAPATTSARPTVTAAAPRSGDTPDAAVSELSAAETSSLRHAQQLLATNDLPALVARLRAAGFSAMDIRGIVSARLAERYGAARVAATAHLEAIPYWRGFSSFPRDGDAGAEVRRLFREQNQALNDLLGPDARATDEWSQMLRDREYGYLPADKVDRLTSIRADYSDLQRSVYEGARGVFTPEDREKLALIEQEQRADIEALFTPEELEAYDLHTSPLSQQLRRLMVGFNPTEAEYKALYRLVSAAGHDGANPVVINQQTFASRPSQTSPTDITNQLASVLTPDRLETFRMATSAEYLQLHRLGTRFNLSDTTLKNAYTIAHATSQRGQAVIADASLDEAAKQAQLSALGQQAEAQLKPLLGSEAYGLYLTQGGRWIGQYQNGTAASRRPLSPQPGVRIR